MKEIYKIKFALNYAMMILSALYLLYYLINLAFNLILVWVYLSVFLDINFISLALFLYFKYKFNNYLKLYLDISRQTNEI